MLVPEIYQPYVKLNRENKVLYLQALNDIYGKLKEELLFDKICPKIYWNIFFTITPYDICLSNKIINRHHMTVVWNLEEIKIFHKNTQDFSVTIEDLKAKYQNEIRKVKVPR